MKTKPVPFATTNLQFAARDLTDQQVRDMLAATLAESQTNCYLQDVNRAQGFFTYVEWENGAQELYRATFTVGDDYSVTVGTPERVVATTRYEALTTEMTFSATLTPDGALVYREGKVSEAGDYPDKAITFTEADFDAAVSDFAPVDMDVEHTNSLLDGNLGKLVKVWRDGTALFGRFAVPAWLQAIFTRDSVAPKVSLTWDRTSKRITKCAWVLNPRVPDAVLMAAFSHSPAQEPGGNILPRPAIDPPPSPAARSSNPMKKFFEGLAAAFGKAAAEAPEDDPGSEKTGAQDPKPAVEKPAGTAFDADNAEMSTLRSRLAQLESERLDAQAETWAETVLADNRALPRERATMVAAFKRAATDDAQSPAKVAFNNGTQTVECSRVDALKVVYANREPHRYTEEMLADTSGVVFADKMTEMSAEVVAELKKTPMGRKALEMMRKEGK